PIFALIKAELPCHGELHSEVRKLFRITCDGSIETPEFKTEIQGEPDKKPPNRTVFNVVDVEKVKAIGSVTVDSTAVSFKTKLNVGSSQGDVNAVISYENGFKINYDAGRLNFADVKNLA